MLVAGEEDPVDGPAGALQTGGRLGTGKDNDVAGRHAHDQLAGHRVLHVVPEGVGQQDTGLETVEGDHQGGRLAVDAQAIEGQVEVVQSRSAEVAPREVHPVEVGPGHQALPVRRTERVRHRHVAVELVDNMLVADAAIADGHQQRQ